MKRLQQHRHLQSWVEPYASEYHLNSNFDKTTYLNDEDVMPTTGADNGLTLEDMRDADYDDPRWEKLTGSAFC